MDQFTNSFGIDVPTTTATVYEIDPPPRSADPWKALGQYERVLGGKVNGSVHQYYRNGDWYLLAIGANTRVDSVRTEEGTVLSVLATHDLDFSEEHDRTPMLQALRNALSWELTTNREFWRFGKTSRYYEWDYSDVIDGFRAYDGYDIRVQYQNGFYLTVNPKTKFASDKTLYQWISEIGIKQTEAKFADRNFFFETNDRPTVRFESISRSETVSDPIIPDDDGPISIIEYAEKEDFPEEIVDKIDPEEPVVRVQYSWSDEPVSAAPSMLRVTPEENTGPMTGYAAKDADDRWEQTKAFVESIDNLKVYDLIAPVNDTPRTDGVGVFNYPVLAFGDSGTGRLRLGASFASDANNSVNPENWDRAKTDYLSVFGPRKTLRGAPSVALFHNRALEADARDAYADVREYFSEYIDMPIQADPGIQAYDDLDELRRWVARYGASTTGALVYLDQHTDTYYDIIEAFDGKPAQHLTHQTYREARDAGDFSDELYNIASALAVKMGVRPYLLSDGLSADAIIGISVAGDERNTATAVLIDGSNGDLVWQTEEQYGTGSKNVAPERTAERIVGDALQAAEEAETIPTLRSVLFHRSGTFGGDEEKGFRTAFDKFEASRQEDAELEWCVIEVQENDHYRLYDQSHPSFVCDTGAYDRLDDETIAVATWAAPLIHQGTPNNLLCSVELAEGQFDIEAIGRDVFDLSFLNWGAPQMKIKHPISTFLPKEMHDILETCPRLQYPPF